MIVKNIVSGTPTFNLTTTILLLLCFQVSISGAAIPPCSKTKKTISTVGRTPDTATSEKKLKVIVDERIELLTVMQLLFEYPLVGRTGIKYKDDVQAYFAAHKNDTSVNYCLNITERYLSFVRPVNYCYHFSFPAFKQVAGLSVYERDNYGFGHHSKDSLYLFIKALKQFYDQTDFHSFYKNHQRFYDSLINNVKTVTEKLDLASILEKHYGSTQYSYTLVLSPLFIEAGMSTFIASKKGNELYSIIGPSLTSTGAPDFDTKWLMQYLVIHEFSHPFCNPLIDKYYNKLEKDSCLFGPVKRLMAKEGNRTWRNVLCELLTRANEINLVRQVFGPEDAEKVYADYIKKGYVYLSGLLPIINHYTANRRKYKSLGELMPTIIQFFDNQASDLHKLTN